MKMQLAAFIICIVSVSATPAIVWRNGVEESASPVHSSDDLSSKALFAELLSAESVDSSLNTVVFLLGRGEGGTETLSGLASQGDIPNVASKQNSAFAVHHHVTGVQSGHSMVSDSSRFGHSSMLISFDEFAKKLSMLEESPVEYEVQGNGMMSKTVKVATKRARQLASSNVVVVDVPANTNPKDIDSAVLGAIENKSIKNIVLTAVRSHREVISEREMHGRRRLEMMKQAGSGMSSGNRRRLEEGEQEADSELKGIYYVSLTPNILAGILSFFLFSTIVYIGVSCMGMISGQDVFVSKMPAVGREA